MNKNKSEDLVVKANALVQASYRLDLVEQRIILLAITTERNNRLNGYDGLLTVTAEDYAAVYGVAKNKAYEEIKEALDTLWRREVTIYTDHTGKPLAKPFKIRWIITRTMETEESKKKGDGTMEFQFHPELKPYIAELQGHFCRHTLGKIAGMTSLHAIRLYELMIDWGQNFQYHQQEVEIAWLKKVFMLTEEYTVINNFKNRVIDVAVSQINEHSDLTCSYTQRKTGRNVTHLTFEFAPKVVEAQTKPVKKAPKRPTKPSDDETGRTRTKAMLGAMYGAS